MKALTEKKSRVRTVVRLQKLAGLMLVLWIMSALITGDAFAQRGGMTWRGAGGWEQNSKYGRLFDPKTVVKISGEVIGVRVVTPLKGMRRGVQMLVRTERENITVHLGPTWFLENQDITLMPKDKVEVVGSKTILQGRTIIIATEVKKDDRVLKLRDENGYPVWSGWKSR